MKKQSLKSLMLLIALIAATSITLLAQIQPKQTIAVLNIDSRGLTYDAQTMGNLVRIELEKTGVFSVLDRYEVADVVAENKIDLNKCYSKTCLVQAGKLLGANKMLGGSVELLGDKIVITLKLIDVASGTFEKSDVTEYLNLPEMQKMVQISIGKILGKEPDKVMLGQLVDYDVPIQSPKNTLKLNGPRMGFALSMGDIAKVETAGKAKGGFDMFPLSFEFGWQKEFQYISAGNFQALVENVFMISGLESGRFIPNYAPLLGFRFGKQAFEFGFGPTFRFVKKADGYFDENNVWHLENEWNQATPNPHEIISRLDSRGNTTLSTGLVIAVGKTFHSGYLNIPVNIFVTPSKDGTSVGGTFGFNIQKKEIKRSDIEQKDKRRNRVDWYMDEKK